MVTTGGGLPVVGGGDVRTAALCDVVSTRGGGGGEGDAGAGDGGEGNSGGGDSATGGGGDSASGDGGGGEICCSHIDNIPCQSVVVFKKPC